MLRVSTSFLHNPSAFHQLPSRHSLLKFLRPSVNVKLPLILLVCKWLAVAELNWFVGIDSVPQLSSAQLSSVQFSPGNKLQILINGGRYGVNTDYRVSCEDLQLRKRYY